MGRHNKDDVQDDTTFDEMVKGLGDIVTEVDCEKCAKRAVEIKEDTDGEVELEIRKAEVRVKPCGAEEWALFCGPCWTAIFLRMSAEVADGLCDGLPVCAPCKQPIPALPFLVMHIELECIDAGKAREFGLDE